MIVETSTHQFYRVYGTDNTSLVYDWLGIEVKRVDAGYYVPAMHAREVLVRRLGTTVVVER